MAGDGHAKQKMWLFTIGEQKQAFLFSKLMAQLVELTLRAVVCLVCHRQLSGVVKQTGSILPASVRIFTAMLHIAMTGAMPGVLCFTVGGLGPDCNFWIQGEDVIVDCWCGRCGCSCCLPKYVLVLAGTCTRRTLQEKKS